MKTQRYSGWKTIINLIFSLSTFFTTIVPFAKKWNKDVFYTGALLNNEISNVFLLLWSAAIQTEPAQTNSDTDISSLQTKSVSLMGNNEASLSNTDTPVTGTYHQLNARLRPLWI